VKSRCVDHDEDVVVRGLTAPRTMILTGTSSERLSLGCMKTVTGTARDGCKRVKDHGIDVNGSSSYYLLEECSND
jgi:hypothetical protein